MGQDARQAGLGTSLSGATSGAGALKRGPPWLTSACWTILRIVFAGQKTLLCPLDNASRVLVPVWRNSRGRQSHI